MKRLLFVLCSLILTTTSIAQNNRLIKGFVQSENGSPITGATIISNHNNENKVKSTEDGAFEIRVSPYATHLGVTKEGYLATKVEIEGSHLLIRLKVDRHYKDSKAKADEMARIEAEKKAAAKAKAEEMTAAKAKSDEQARIEAEKKAAAKAKAEKQARIEAEKKAAAKAKADEQARIEAEKQKQLAERKRLAKAKAENNKKEYGKQNKGYRGIVDVAYINKKASPALGLSYTAGYQFNNQIYVGAGTGVNFNFKGAPSYLYIDRENSLYLSPSIVSIPLFAYFKANFINGRISPYFAIAAGGNLSTKQTLHLELYDVKYNNNSIFTNPQLGLSYRTTTDTSLNFAIGLHCYTTPKCSEFTGYNATINSAFMYAVDFHLSFTF